MHNYELLYVVRPDLTDQDVGTLRADIQNQVTKMNGEIVREDDWGKRQLAFEIKDYTEGVYTLLTFRLPPENPGKLKEQLKIDERVIRYMLTVAEQKKSKACESDEEFHMQH